MHHTQTRSHGTEAEKMLLKMLHQASPTFLVLRLAGLFHMRKFTADHKRFYDVT